MTNISNDAQIFAKLSSQFSIKTEQVQAFADLYDEGNSVPFIARYRKDKTGGLDDEMLRNLEKSLNFERELAEYRQKIEELIATQTDLTDELKNKIADAQSKLALDDIYAPYRPKRRTLASKARLAGLGDFATKILAGEPLTILNNYVPVNEVTDETGEKFSVDYSTHELQLSGIAAIIIDDWATELDLLEQVRIGFGKTAQLHSALTNEEKREIGEKFKDYFEYNEPFTKVTSHRFLAILRGRGQEILTVKIVGEDMPFIDRITTHFGLVGEDDRHQFLKDCAKKLWADKWRPQIEHRLLTETRLNAETVAIDIFAKNLRHLLMSAPVGQQRILGVDPGFKNGVKMAVIDRTGDVLDTATVYPFTSGNEGVAKAKAAIKQLITQYEIPLIAIGNGTASRESETLIKDILKEHQLPATALVVSEAGASVYSASEIASTELPTLDVSVRGAVSIARRLQDPLSELVKVEPKAIGVGQYQHDVNQSELERSLDAVTEDCVNAVGVDVNTASPAILAHIAGLNKNVANQIVKYRSENGAFNNRNELKAVPRLGAKTFEQSAGFLRIKGGDEPLDATGVHPESYALVYDLLKHNHLQLNDLIGNQAMIDKLLVNETAFSTTTQVLKELAKPAHDPRGEFVTAKFTDGINEIKDLQIGMMLEGVVTNVTAFGCFVDIGVHQDGLVHISELSDHFVSDPNEVVKPSQIVKVRVLEVDEKRKRIALSMKSDSDNKNSFGKKSDKPSKLGVNTTNFDKPKPSKTQNINNPKTMGSFGALLQNALNK